MAPPRWLAKRLGRRGLALAVLGLAFVLIGLRSWIAPVDPEEARFLFHFLAPGWVRAVVWIGAGLTALVAACKRDGRDGFGFAALTVPATFVFFSYLWSVVAFLVGISTWPLGWTSAVIWLLILALILLISGWPDVRIPPRHRRTRGGGSHA